MRRLLLALGVAFFLSWTCLAQTSTDDSPATKADVERYFQVVKSHDMMKKLMASMTQGMHQMRHEQYLKQRTMEADYESKMTSKMDEMYSLICRWMK